MKDTVVAFGASDVKKIRKMKERLIYLENKIELMNRIETIELESKAIRVQQFLKFNQLTNYLKKENLILKHQLRRKKLITVSIAVGFAAYIIIRK